MPNLLFFGFFHWLLRKVQYFSCSSSFLPAALQCLFLLMPFHTANGLKAFNVDG